MEVKLWLWYHLRENRQLYVMVIAFFLVGIIAGALVVQLLHPAQLQELASYLDVSLAGLVGAPFDQRALVQKALGQNLCFILVIGFLGLTVIGIPLVLILVGMRGFLLGFTVGFLITEKAGAGVILAVLTILPQNLFYIPAIIVAGALALGLSFRLVKGRQAPFTLSLWEHLFGYLLALAATVLLAGTGGLIESYFTPIAVRWLLSGMSLSG